VKKVLIITCWYPPRPYPSLRIVGLGKYLPEFGWQPVLLTTARGELRPQFQVIETSYRDALSFWKRLLGFNPDKDTRKEFYDRFNVASKNRVADFFLTRIGELVNYPDQYRGWRPLAVRAGSELLRNQGFDVILSSSMPVISHLIARELKTRYQTPWLADFRDLWTQNTNYNYGALRRLMERRLEVKTISSADALVIISQPTTETLGKLHKGRPIYTITNGFDPLEVNSPPVHLTSRFTITYTGSIYPRGQQPSRFFAAVRDLVSGGTIEPDDIEIRFYGPRESWLEKEISDYGLSGIIKQYGIVPREMALEKQRESQLLLLLKWEDPRERGSYTGKVFEYLAARRPVLATGGSSDVIDELLGDTGAGMCAPAIEDIKNTLQKLYQEYRVKGRIAYQGEEARVNRYSHREMAGKFAEILNSLA
jgi:glycosyltransferase involved in cell wall biosynthesis